MEKVNGKDVDKIPADTPKIVINEIAQSDECGVPGGAGQLDWTP